MLSVKHAMHPVASENRRFPSISRRYRLLHATRMQHAFSAIVLLMVPSSDTLTSDDRAVIAELLRDTIAVDRYPLSPRIRRLKAILAKLEPPSAVEPMPAPKPSAVPSSALTKKRWR